MTTTFTPDQDEAQIRAVIDRWVEAFRLKDVEQSLSIHAPEMMSFDIVPPLRYQGLGEYGRAWSAAFDLFDGQIVMDLRDVTITARNELAFSHSLNHFQGTTTSGEATDYWFRWTACFQKLDGRWLIVHDHTPLPTDFATGESVQTLQP